jgi:hypothetical protein
VKESRKVEGLHIVSFEPVLLLLFAIYVVVFARKFVKL